VRRAAIAVLSATALGILLGAVAQVGDHFVPSPLPWIFALGVPWLAAAWAAGAVSGRWVESAVVGAVVLTVATGAYYVLHVRFHGISVRLVGVILGWGLASLAAGAAFGLAGAGWRSGRPAVRVCGVALLAGAMAGEALLLSHEWPARVTGTVLFAELLAAAAVPFLLVRPWRAVPAALVLTAAAALVLGAAEGEVREVLRGAGWRGL
jgi:hypothetical protein